MLDRFSRSSGSAAIISAVTAAFPHQNRRLCEKVRKQFEEPGRRPTAGAVESSIIALLLVNWLKTQPDADEPHRLGPEPGGPAQLDRQWLGQQQCQNLTKVRSHPKIN